jgi:hypothetical protein
MFISNLPRKNIIIMEIPASGIKPFSRPLVFFFFIFSMIFGFSYPAAAAVDSVSLSVPSPTTLSDGKGYFLAGTHDYAFSVTTSNSGAGTISNIRLRIYYSAAAYFEINDSGAGGSVPTGMTSVVTGGTWNSSASMMRTYTVRFNGAAVPAAFGGWTVEAYVTDSASGNMSAIQTGYYGICSRITVAGFSQSGTAADGMISTGNAAFNVTGTFVYDIPGTLLESASDAVSPSADVMTPYLHLQNSSSVDVSAAIALSNASSSFTASVPASYVTSAGKLNWSVYANFSGGASSKSANTLTLLSNTVTVSSISLTDGYGRGVYRAYGVAGTNITVTAQMTDATLSGSAMNGDTTLTITAACASPSKSGTFTVTIPSGQTSVTAAIPYNSSLLPAFSVVSGTAEYWTYTVTGAVSSSGYNLAQTAVTQPAASGIYWDNGDAPGSVTEIPAVTVQPRATYIIFSWTPLPYTTAPDEDFYEYRIHFRESGGSWKVWTGDNDATLRWPVSSLSSGLVGGLQTTTIPNLKIFTSYEYYITAADIFGNEMNAGAAPTTPVSVKTLPYSIDVALTDGVTRYEESSFADLTPTVRPLKETAIKVELSITGADELPETVRIWYCIDAATPNIVLVGSTSTINSGAFTDAANPLLSEVASKTGPNKWVAYLPATNVVIKAGNNVRFIVETVRNNVSAFSDNVVETVPDPNAAEWTFCITGTAKFTPYPTRILNNVISSGHPTAYPSYYLSDDAYVTITVYDIKGRPVVTLIDGAFRHGGVNIKENGWQGKNKAGNKCGIGLYHVHFKATRASDGRVILNEFKKLVISK